MTDIALPGAELITQGLRDLARRTVTVESLLIFPTPANRRAVRRLCEL